MIIEKGKEFEVCAGCFFFVCKNFCAKHIKSINEPNYPNKCDYKFDIKKLVNRS